jgi:hypothetical protein
MNERDRRLLRRLMRDPDFDRIVAELRKQPGPRRGGRKKGALSHKYDKYLLPMLEHFCRVAKREKGLSRTEAIRWVVGGVDGPGMLADGRSRLLGKSERAAVARLFEKKTAGDFRPARFPPWVHPSKLTLKALGEPTRSHLDALLDEALEQTFPASDPIAVQI